MVLAPEHALVQQITTADQKAAVDAYIQQASYKSDLDRTDLAKDKTGVFTGAYAINPVNGKRTPIWIADYVLVSYGTGAIMAVPAHDERDFAFATQFGIPIIPVIQEAGKSEPVLPFSGVGIMQNSAHFDGLSSDACKRQIIAELESNAKGKSTVNFKLRDWLFSRQRYWGEPFPILWVSDADYATIQAANGALAEFLPESPVSYKIGEQTLCAVPLPASALPLTLPVVEAYKPAGDGQSPLANATDWVSVWLNVTTGETISATQSKPTTGAWVRAERETNTMPQWAGSCWYYLRYCDPHNAQRLIDPAVEQYWQAPDFYIGGSEHAVLHLLYARFWHQFLFDIGVVTTPEPFRKLFHQGIILGEDGEKMSKSRGNVVNPDDCIAKYGADALRLYEMFMGPLEDAKPWNSQGIEGLFRFLKRVWREFIDREGGVAEKISDTAIESLETLKLVHESIRKLTNDIEKLRYNTGISQLMILLNHLQKETAYSTQTARIFTQLLAPYAPHIGEELWERLGGTGTVTTAPWPVWNEAFLVENEVAIGLLVNGKPRGELKVPVDATQDTILELARQQERFNMHIEGKTIRKVIFVPGKILNVVAN
jgi:leucyl-tRNA synthetase